MHACESVRLVVVRHTHTHSHTHWVPMFYGDFIYNDLSCTNYNYNL